MTPLKESSVKEKEGKPVKSKPPLEREILRDICEELERQGLFFWRTNNVPTVQKFGVNGGMRMRAMPKFSAKGIADILCVRDGEFIALEVKRPGLKLRPEQVEWGNKVCQHGGNYFKVCSVQEALSVLGYA